MPNKDQRRCPSRRSSRFNVQRRPHLPSRHRQRLQRRRQHLDRRHTPPHLRRLHAPPPTDLHALRHRHPDRARHGKGSRLRARLLRHPLLHPRRHRSQARRHPLPPHVGRRKPQPQPQRARHPSPRPCGRAHQHHQRRRERRGYSKHDGGRVGRERFATRWSDNYHTFFHYHYYHYRGDDDITSISTAFPAALVDPALYNLRVCTGSCIARCASQWQADGCRLPDRYPQLICAFERIEST